MMNDPIQVTQHHSPLPVAGRDTDPGRYKGSAAMVMKGYRTEQERVKDAVAANSFLTLEPGKPHEFRPRNPEKEINPNMHFSSKSHSTSQNSIFPKISQNKSFSIDLSRKTHFKGVMSKLMNQSLQMEKVEEAMGEMEENVQVLQRTKTAALLWKHGKVLNRTVQKYEGATMAKGVLESCQVIPKATSHSYLRVGSGKLISNPFVPTRDLYFSLYHSSSPTASSPPL